MCRGPNPFSLIHLHVGAGQVTQWLMTLLAYCLPLPVLVRVWDVVFLDGWKALFRIALALLKAVEEDLLPLNLEDSGRYEHKTVPPTREPVYIQPDQLLTAFAFASYRHSSRTAASSASGRRSATRCGGTRAPSSALRGSGR